jgi:hypothetical protein
MYQTGLLLFWIVKIATKTETAHNSNGISQGNLSAFNVMLSR